MAVSELDNLPWGLAFARAAIAARDGDDLWTGAESFDSGFSRHQRAASVSARRYAEVEEDWVVARRKASATEGGDVLRAVLWEAASGALPSATTDRTATPDTAEPREGSAGGAVSDAVATPDSVPLRVARVDPTTSRPQSGSSLASPALRGRVHLTASPSQHTGSPPGSGGVPEPPDSPHVLTVNSHTDWVGNVRLAMADVGLTAPSLARHHMTARVCTGCRPSTCPQWPPALQPPRSPRWPLPCHPSA